MGNQQHQQTTQVQKPKDLDEQILEMRMTSKQFEMESKRAEKEKDKQMNKAREALKKGNEEGSRLYLQNAANKRKESLNLLRMSHKIDAISSQIKMNRSNQQMVNELNKITPILNINLQDTPIEKIQMNMASFEEAMDKLLVQGKVLEQITQSNPDALDVDEMFDQLKTEHRNQINLDLGMQNQYQMESLQSPQQMQQMQAQNVIKQNQSYN